MIFPEKSPNQYYINFGYEQFNYFPILGEPPYQVRTKRRNNNYGNNFWLQTSFVDWKKKKKEERRKPVRSILIPIRKHIIVYSLFEVNNRINYDLNQFFGYFTQKKKKTKEKDMLMISAEKTRNKNE